MSSCIVSMSFVEDRVIALNRDGTYAVFINGGNAWTTHETLKTTLPADDFRSISADFKDGNQIVAITPTFGAYTDNGGTSWKTFDFPFGLAAAGVSKTAASTIILIYPNGFVRRSLDNGMTWQSPGNIIGLGSISRVSTNDDQIFVVDTTGKVAYTTNGNAPAGIIWSSPLDSGLSNPAGVSGKNTDLSVVADNGSGRYSKDSGQTWFPWIQTPTITGNNNVIVAMVATYGVVTRHGEVQTSDDITPPENWVSTSIPPITTLPECTTAPSNIIYVDGDKGKTDSGCGFTKDNPCKSLEAALGKATKGMQVWVAATIDTNPYKPSKSFVIPTGVKVYGGFTHDFSERDFVNNVTTLSGNRTAKRSVTSFTGVDPTTTLDGFTISGAFVPEGGGCVISDSSPQIANCVFWGNQSLKKGGAVYNVADKSNCSPSFNNCVFLGNHSFQEGGAVYNNIFSRTKKCSPSFNNCVFYSNSANRGGAVYNNSKCSSSFTFVTFFNNGADFSSHILYNASNSSANITNCILWGSFDEAFGLIFNDSGATTTISYSDIINVDHNGIDRGITLVTNNISENPDFLNFVPSPTNEKWFTYESGLSIRPNSPCLAKGKDQPNILVDITGAPRPEFPSMGAYDSRNHKVIKIDKPGPTRVKLDIGINEILTSVIIIAKGADGGNLYDTATIPPTIKKAGGKGTTLRVIYTDTGVLEKIKTNGIVVNVGASWQTFDLLEGDFIFKSTGGGPTSAFIPTKDAVIPNPSANFTAWNTLFRREASKITDLLFLAGGGGGGSKEVSGDNAPSVVITTNGDTKQKAGIGKSQLGPGGGAYPFGPGLITADIVEMSTTTVNVNVLNGTTDASGGSPPTTPPTGDIFITKIGQPKKNLASAKCFDQLLAGFYLGGLAGFDLILPPPHSQTPISIGTFGGGGGAGYSGGDGATDTQAAQGGVSYVNPDFKPANSSITIASLDAEQAAYEDAEEGATGDADAPLEHSQGIVISQNEASEIERAFRALRTTFETASVEELVEIFFNSEVLGITNEREKQGSVIISYITAPIPTPTSAVPQETEIISTNMVYDWNISTSTQKIQLDLES